MRPLSVSGSVGDSVGSVLKSPMMTVSSFMSLEGSEVWVLRIQMYVDKRDGAAVRSVELESLVDFSDVEISCCLLYVCR